MARGILMFHRQDGQCRKDAVAGIHFQGHCRKQPLPCRGAAHRPHEIGRIGAREHLVDEPGILAVGRQRDIRGVEPHALLHQVAPHQFRARFQVVDRNPRVEPVLLAPHRDDDLPEVGLAPTPAPPTSERSKRRTPPMGPLETTFTDPDNRSPRPWVEIVSTPNGSIPVWTVRAPSSVTTRSLFEVAAGDGAKSTQPVALFLIFESCNTSVDIVGWVLHPKTLTGPLSPTQARFPLAMPATLRHRVGTIATKYLLINHSSGVEPVRHSVPVLAIL